MKRQNFSSGTRWEAEVGYSRAVRVGDHVFVAGTTATDADGNVIGKDDPGAQARQILGNLERALAGVGAELRHVVRTRMFVTDIGRWQQVGAAHGAAFAAIRPATTLVEVKGFVHPDMMVEIEAEAIVSDEATD